MLSKKSTSICSSLQRYPEVDLEFHRENSTEKILSWAKQKLQTHLLTESCKVKIKDFNSKEEDLFSARRQYFFYFVLLFPDMSL